jgi:hypothetical protein
MADVFVSKTISNSHVLEACGSLEAQAFSIALRYFLNSHGYFIPSKV